MTSLELSIKINAPRELLWEAVVDPDLYRIWTEAFTPGSDFDGSWVKGSKIKFIAEDEFGIQSGMTSEIAESRWPEYISIRHLGLLNDGVEDFDSPAAKLWAPAYENYTFEELDPENSLFRVYMDLEEEHVDMFKNMWDAALDKLATLCESLKQKPFTITLRQKSSQSPEKIWSALTDPEQVKAWNFADESWHCPSARNDLRVGGEFHYEMAAKDGSASFDFGGTYTAILPNEQLTFELGDGRKTDIRIIPKPYGCLIEERFGAETENNLNLQRMGWGMILARLANYADTTF